VDKSTFERVVALGHRMFPQRRKNIQDNPKGVNQAYMAQLLEEAGELAGASRTLFGREMRPEKVGSIEEVKSEIGDVMVVLCAICELHQVEPLDCLNGVITKLEQRCEGLGR
jgi:NTP pyrophosphatase (non-canonical NTP hydrolase)